MSAINTLDRLPFDLKGGEPVTVILPPTPARPEYVGSHRATEDPTEVAALTRQPAGRLYVGTPPPLPAFPFLESRSRWRVRSRLAGLVGLVRP